MTFAALLAREHASVACTCLPGTAAFDMLREAAMLLPRFRSDMRGAAQLALLGFATLGTTVLGASGCDNDCDFFERCNGHVREVCGDGPDQVFHRRIRSEPCEAPNSACVERDEDHAACVLPGEARCDDASFVPRCDGDMRIGCTPALGYAGGEPPAYEVGADCASAGRVCVASDEGATCEPP